MLTVVRVLYLVGRLQRGGVFYVLVREVQLCLTRGADVAIGALEASSKALMELRELGLIDRTFIGIDSLGRVAGEVDVVHVHDGFRLFLYARLNRWLDELFRIKPIVVTFHGIPDVKLLPLRSWPLWFTFNILYYRLLKRYAKLVIAVSEYVAKQLKLHGIEPIILYNGVDIPSQKSYKRYVGDTLELLYVGSAAKHKRLEELLFLVDRLGEQLSRALSIDVRLTVVGFNVEELARKYKSKRIVFYGSLPRKEVLKFYATKHIYVSPSAWEGFGMGVLEALSHGMPVIARDIPVMKELYGRCPSVKLLKSFKDYKTFAKYLKEILNKYEYYSALAIRCAANYTWDKHIDKLLSLYENVASKR